MTGLLAYDPEWLARLRARLIDALDELRMLRCNDVVAGDTLHAIASIRDEAENVWLAVISGILDSDALTGRLRVLVGLDRIENALIASMANDRGWSVSLDAFGSPPMRMTIAEARALGEALNSIDVETLARDPQLLRFLATQLLVIGRDPILSRHFLELFSVWAPLCNTLALERAQSFRSDRDTKSSAAEIDAVFDGLMSVWATTLQAGALSSGAPATLQSLLPDTDTIDLYAQALMLRSLRPTAITAAILTNELLSGWLARKADPSVWKPYDLQIVVGPNSADILLPLLLADPVACVYFAKLAAADPRLLFETLDDPDIGYRVALVGTDPRNIGSQEVEASLLAILNYFRTDPYKRMIDTDGYPGDYGPFLGELVAPWLLQFTFVNRDWRATAGEKASLLRVALHDDAALKMLADRTAQIHRGYVGSHRTFDLNAATQVGALLNMVLQLSINETVHDEATSHDQSLSLLWAAITIAGSFLPGGPLTGIAAGFATSAVSAKVNEYLDHPDPNGVRRGGERAMDLALALAAADALAELHRRWEIDQPRQPIAPPPVVEMAVATTSDEPTKWCPTAEFLVAVAEWQNQLPGGAAGPLGREAQSWVNAYVGPAAAQANCAEVAG